MMSRLWLAIIVISCSTLFGCAMRRVMDAQVLHVSADTVLTLTLGFLSVIGVALKWNRRLSAIEKDVSEIKLLLKK